MHRRTSVSADQQALEALEHEARWRGVSLDALLAEAIHEKAALITRRPPQVGSGESSDGRSAAEVASRPVALP